MRKNIKGNYLKNRRGSVLVFSLFVMMISLIIGVSLMTTSTVGRKNTLSSAKSVNSFQVADSGIEYAFRRIREYRWDEPLHKLDLSDRLEHVFPGGLCTNSPAKVSGSANGGSYDLYFYKDAGGATQMMSCTNSLNSQIKQITKIKSVGTYNGIIRSVEVNVDFTDL